MDTQQTELFERIRGFVLDQAGVTFPFSHKLAKENGWSVEYAQRVIEEYKRFVFLGVAAGHPVSPADAVDQAWHLHMTYTQSYWGEFCPKVLGRPFHHLPAQGGIEEADKLQDWYGKTIESYSRFFGEAPPSDIWLTPEMRAQGVEEYVRVNKNAY